MQRSAIQTWVAGIVLATVCMILFHPATSNQFVSDDFHYFHYNQLWISSFRTEHLVWMFTSFELWNWHPLTWLSWALDYQVYGGLSAWGFHLTNNILHALNTVLTFLLFRSFLVLSLRDTQWPAHQSRILWSSFIAAILFAVHPQHVESVAWVSSRQHLLCHAFLLMATMAYLRHQVRERGHSAKWLRVSAFCFLLAGLAKPTAIIFPFVLLILDVYPLRRLKPASGSGSADTAGRWQALLLEKRNFIILAVLLAIPTLVARTTATHDIALIDRILNAFSATVFYLEKLLVPVDYSTYYAYFVEQGGPHGFQEGLPVLVFALITIFCIITWRKGQPWWMAAWAFYLLTLAPVIGIIPTGPQGGADRYAYLPTVPAYLFVGAGIYYLLRTPRIGTKIAVMSGVSLLAAMLSFQTLRQIEAWESNLTVWSNAYRYFPEDAYVNHQLGAAMLENGDRQTAAHHFSLAYRKDASRVQSLAWLGLTNIRLGRFEEALQNSLDLGSHAATGAPPRVDEQCLVYNIAWLLAQLGRYEEAAAQFSIMPLTGDFQALTREWRSWLESMRTSGEAASDNDTGIGRLPGACVAPLYEMRRRPLDPGDQPRGAGGA